MLFSSFVMAFIKRTCCLRCCCCLCYCHCCGCCTPGFSPVVVVIVLFVIVVIVIVVHLGSPQLAMSQGREELYGDMFEVLLLRLYLEPWRTVKILKGCKSTMYMMIRIVK